MRAVAILTIGNEITDGRVVDSNSAFIAKELRKIGLLPVRIASCRDDVEEITKNLCFLAEQASVIIVSGGLGPTSDDKTREAVSEYSGRKLQLDPEQLALLKEYYRHRGREFELANQVQAMVPEGARAIRNVFGTAPGLDLLANEKTRVFCVPGVPKEMKAMITEDIAPQLSEGQAPLFVKTFHLFGTPESVTARRIHELNLSKEISIGYRPHFPEIEVRLSSENNLELEQATEKVRSVVQEFLYSEQEIDSLPNILARLLMESGKTVSVAESCTGGFLGKLLTDLPGSSAFFEGGVLSYSNQVKSSVLKVPSDLLEEHGAVSHQTAKAMAHGVRTLVETDYALSITGVAGPDGGTEDKPVGLFFVGLATHSITKSFRFEYPSNRDYVRKMAASSALDTLRRFMLGLPFLGKEA